MQKEIDTSFDFRWAKKAPNRIDYCRFDRQLRPHLRSDNIDCYTVDYPMHY